MKLAEAFRKYRLGFIHSPRHFQTNSFKVEREGKRLLLVGTPKRHSKKRFHIVAVLKQRR